MDNCLFYNCGRLLFLADQGGSYNITHCTFDGSHSKFVRQYASLGIGNSSYKDPMTQADVKANLKASIINSIIYGSEEEEVQLLSDETQTKLKAQDYFQNSILKTKEFSSLTGNYINIDPQYVNVEQEDFHLSGSSKAKDKAKATTISDDLDDVLRDMNPDIGCYEIK